MEALIAIGAAALGALGAFGLKLIGSQLFLSKYGSVITTVFNVLDPLAGELITAYDESTFQKAAQLVVARVADSEVDEKDIFAMTKFVVEQFNPTLASSKKLDPETDEGKATLELSESVKALTDGASFDELVDVARKAAALV